MEPSPTLAPAQHDVDADTRPTAPPEPQDMSPLAGGALLTTGIRVVEHLHRSNESDVYLVFDEGRHCTCVAKQLRPDCEPDGSAAGRLRNEARLLAEMTHPNVVRLYEVFEQPRLTLLLERIDGITLSNAMRACPELPLSDVVLLGRHLCAALIYLHRQGVLHLDLKGANVLVGNGRATIIDMSIARPPGRIAAGIGTEEYMAPEQVRGNRVTAATDVWGVGAVLYKAATGRRAFQHRERRGEPQLRGPALPVRTFRPDLPAPLGRMIDRCLSEAPSRRPSMGEVAALFDGIELVPAG